MKVCFDTFSSGVKKIRYHDKTKNILEILDKNQHLKRRVAYSKFSLDVESQEFNSDHEVIGQLHKKYTPDGYIETYNGIKQQYVREVKTFVKDSFTHCIEKFTSKTSPESSYINEFIRDIKGRLVKIINNGKEINLV